MDAVLAVVLGDVVAFVCRELLTRERALKWMQDLADVLVLEAVERFQVQLTFPDGTERAFDYEILDGGQVSASDGCGGFSTHWIPSETQLSLVIRWRKDAPKLQIARALLAQRGWGTGSLLVATGSPDRTYSKDGYGLQRRSIGDWSDR